MQSAAFQPGPTPAFKPSPDKPTDGDSWKDRPASPATIPMPQQPRSKRSLLEIGEDFDAIDDLLAECGGDITGVEATIDAWFAEADKNLSDKVDGYCWFYKSLTHRAAVRKEEAARLANRARIDENAAAWLKERLRQFFVERQIKKLETSRFKLTVANNGGKLPLAIDPTIESDPVAFLPEKFRREVTTVVIEKDLIREALEAGQSIDGCTLGERGNHLRIM